MSEIKFKLFLYYAIALAIEGQSSVVGQIGIKTQQHQMPISQNLLYYNESFPTKIPLINANHSANYFHNNNDTSGISGNHQNDYSQNATFNFINKTLGSRPTGICFIEVP